MFLLGGLRDGRYGKIEPAMYTPNLRKASDNKRVIHVLVRPSMNCGRKIRRGTR